MNTLGCHTPPFYGASFMPYVAQIRCVDICHYMVPTKEDYHDVFSPDFANLCEHKARAVALPRTDDPYLLGYSMTDCPIFTNLDAAPRIENVYRSRRPGLPLWPVVLRNLDATAPENRLTRLWRGNATGTTSAGSTRSTILHSPASTICCTQKTGARRKTIRMPAKWRMISSFSTGSSTSATKSRSLPSANSTPTT